MAPRLKLFIPLALFGVLALLLARGLQLDPKELPSALIDRPLPNFSLPALESGDMLTNATVTGEVALFNVWATWCITCRVEHPYLEKLAAAGVPIYGINYKDDSSAARRWLAELGNPYRANIVDAEGTLGLDLGVYGAPETYLVDGAGIVRYRHVGEVNDRIWESTLGPLYRQLAGGESGS
ncbi:DsbE family thiol:disulfide interchange protein [Pseudohaliea rubra]|uniref:Cytochrome c-type biogenesis protein CcmG/DsbE, thiol:disulfide oxidoreductase n=1 Tax=Pseudohaliea rubra DSM 19751 TaxID=1265313 RepID=A0A095WXQ6_9GAMM|nr:DsbE family thiol:disulfide interchange protein [Pseudohaliea rubra]KGE03414.1 Cytochrome c-type biogenesis protein CcmG/DsbE, thiol:disulfide oxidoreductase [Pseudohaliea rubra DSM 19751]